jgi:hypothetical protein
LLKGHEICKSHNRLEKTQERDGLALYWLNPQNQKCFNFGWFCRQDFIDWMQGTGKIVKGSTPEEKQKFWQAACFESKYDYGWSVGYSLKYFHLLDTKYEPKFESSGNWMNRKIDNSLKISSKNHAEIIGKVFGQISRYYSDMQLNTIVISIGLFMMNLWVQNKL